MDTKRVCVCFFFLIFEMLIGFVGLETGGDDLGFSKWFEELQGKPGL